MIVCMLGRKGGWQPITGRRSEKARKGRQSLPTGSQRVAECYLVESAGMLAVWHLVECIIPGGTYMRCRDVESAAKMCDGDVGHGGYGHEVVAGR